MLSSVLYGSRTREHLRAAWLVFYNEITSQLVRHQVGAISAGSSLFSAPDSSVAPARRTAFGFAAAVAEKALNSKSHFRDFYPFAFRPLAPTPHDEHDAITRRKRKSTLLVSVEFMDRIPIQFVNQLGVGPKRE